MMMRNHTILGLAAIAGLCGAPALSAQQGTPPPASEPQEAAGIQALIEQLGAEKNADRKAAEKALVERGDAARAALEEALQSHDDPEVRWRARRVLRQLDGEQPRLQGRGAEPDDPGDERQRRDGPGARRGEAMDRMVEMMERMERAFGQDFGGLDDLQRQLDEMQQRMEELHGGTMPGLKLFGAGPGRAAQGTQIQIGPDGVRVQVQEQGEDGETETRTYEAESLEAFREQHPEVAKRFLGPEGGLWITGPGITGPGITAPGITVPQGARRLRAPFAEGDLPPEWKEFTRINPDYFQGTDAPADGERLGILVGELAPAVREFLEIAPDQGLLVQSVDEDSLAAALGLQPKDIVLRIGDRAIAGASDVQAALRGIPKGDPVVVEVNRKGTVVRLEATKQHDAPTGKLRPTAEDGEAPGAGGR